LVRIKSKARAMRALGITPNVLQSASGLGRT